MVNRRQFLLSAGSLAASASPVAGTGASAARSVTVEVAEDADAYLRLTPVPDSGTADYVAVEDGRLTVDVSAGTTTSCTAA